MTLYIGHPTGYEFGDTLTLFDDREHYETVRGIHESDGVEWKYWEAPDWPESTAWEELSFVSFEDLRDRERLATQGLYHVWNGHEYETWAYSPDGEGVYWYSRAELFVQHGI